MVSFIKSLACLGFLTPSPELEHLPDDSKAVCSLKDKILALQELLQASEQTHCGFERTLESNQKELQQYKAALARERFDHHRTQASNDQRRAEEAQALARLEKALAKEKEAHSRTQHYLDVCTQADSEHKPGCFAGSESDITAMGPDSPCMDHLKSISDAAFAAIEKRHAEDRERRRRELSGIARHASV
ncbi:hypothetical protein WJX74_004650 [Apatococcus lobatus]|uniref:Uncharacterized protein n=1 Tax=Apatococcus lobatus TaxID=904363 RepID=A0AAW1S9L8_9CHLO